jgi:diketogulonate reductase-like aldo/keto reductase
VDQTLSNLGVDQLDLFLIHWPLPRLYGGDYVSTWTTLTELVAEGRLRSAGVSNFQPAHLERLLTETGIAPVVDQIELHPNFANTDACEASRRHGIAVEAHSSLGHSREPLTDDTITRIAAAHGKSTTPSPLDCIARRATRTTASNPVMRASSHSLGIPGGRRFSVYDIGAVHGAKQPEGRTR